MVASAGCVHAALYVRLSGKVMGGGKPAGGFDHSDFHRDAVDVAAR